MYFTVCLDFIFLRLSAFIPIECTRFGYDNIRIHSNPYKSKGLFEKNMYWNVYIQMVSSICRTCIFCPLSLSLCLSIESYFVTSKAMPLRLMLRVLFGLVANQFFSPPSFSSSHSLFLSRLLPHLSFTLIFSHPSFLVFSTSSLFYLCLSSFFEV